MKTRRLIITGAGTKPRPDQRPRRAIRAASTATLLGTTAAAGLLIGAVVANLDPAASTGPGVLPVPTATDSPAYLIDLHNCWTGEAPDDMQGRVPGAVVATLPGHAKPTYGGPRLVAKALSQVFDGQDYGLTVHAFCRGGDRG